jgi:hypothetical protein
LTRGYVAVYIVSLFSFLKAGGPAVQIAITKPLFAWDSLEDSPSLSTVRRFLQSLPDGKLLDSLRRHRGRGRDDYPVQSEWGVLLLSALLRHPGIEACLEELGRNEALRLLIGIQSEAEVPKPWNMSRFLDVLGTEPHRGLLREIFDTLVKRMGEAVRDLGAQTAGDSTGLSARSGDGGCQDGLEPPSGGRKEYVDEGGEVLRVVEWFGYKLHLLVDRRHEVALAYAVSSPKVADAAQIPDLVKEAKGNLPEGRIRSLAYDKAADDEATHRYLAGEGISPLIENRSLWKGEHERMLPGHDARSNVVYDEAGTLYCYNKEQGPPVRHRMAYIGHEKSRGTLKYRCPARHWGWQCGSEERCNAGKKYGKTVRLKCEIDLRRFPPIPRATKQFERLYKGRTAVERVNARLKVFWGADDGNTVGARRFHAHVGAVMVVHAALATLLASTARKEGPLGQMRLGPIARALAEAKGDGGA